MLRTACFSRLLNRNVRQQKKQHARRLQRKQPRRKRQKKLLLRRRQMKKLRNTTAPVHPAVQAPAQAAHPAVRTPVVPTNSYYDDSSSSSSSSSSSTGMIWPVGSSSITSYFGYRSSPTAGASSYHRGLDIGASAGSSIWAAASGTVITASYNSAMGNYIVISHGNGVLHCL